MNRTSLVQVRRFMDNEGTRGFIFVHGGGWGKECDKSPLSLKRHLQIFGPFVAVQPLSPFFSFSSWIFKPPSRHVFHPVNVKLSKRTFSSSQRVNLSQRNGDHRSLLLWNECQFAFIFELSYQWIFTVSCTLNFTSHQLLPRLWRVICVKHLFRSARCW